MTKNDSLFTLEDMTLTYIDLAYNNK